MEAHVYDAFVELGKPCRPADIAESIRKKHGLKCGKHDINSILYADHGHQFRIVKKDPAETKGAPLWELIPSESTSADVPTFSTEGLAISISEDKNTGKPHEIMKKLIKVLIAAKHTRFSCNSTPLGKKAKEIIKSEGGKVVAEGGDDEDKSGDDEDWAEVSDGGDEGDEGGSDEGDEGDEGDGGEGGDDEPEPKPPAKKAAAKKTAGNPSAKKAATKKTRK
jgi:hypothetical protein